VAPSHTSWGAWRGLLGGLAVRRTHRPLRLDVIVTAETQAINHYGLKVHSLED